MLRHDLDARAWRYTLLLVLFYLLMAVAYGKAEAQTYVRPAKSPSVTVFNAVTGTTTSGVYDFTAFEGVQITAVTTGTCTGNIQVQGASTATGTYATLSVANARRTLSSDTTIVYDVGGLLPYTKFVYTTADGACTMTGRIVPIPFAFTKGAVGVNLHGDPTGGDDRVFPIIIGGVSESAIRTAIDDADFVAATYTTDGALWIAGFDGTNPRKIKTDTGGAVQVDVESMPSNSSVNLAQVNGQTVNVGAGAAGTGTARVTTSTDSTIGTVTTLSQFAGAAINLGLGDTGTGTLRVQAAATGTLDTGGDGCAAVTTDAGGTTLLAAYAGRRQLHVKNGGNEILYCALGAVPTATDYHFLLRGGAADHDGLGDGFSVDNWSGTLLCLANATAGIACVVGY